MLSHLFGFILSFYIMMAAFPALLRVFFCDAVSNSDYTESNDRKSDELWIEKKFKWIGYGLINVLSQHLPGRIAEPHKHQDSQWPSRDWNKANKSRALSLHQSIKCIMVV